MHGNWYVHCLIPRPSYPDPHTQALIRRPSYAGPHTQALIRRREGPDVRLFNSTLVTVVEGYKLKLSLDFSLLMQWLGWCQEVGLLLSDM